MDAAQVNIIIDIKARLEELAKAQSELNKTKSNALSLGDAFRTGLGVEAVRRSVEITAGVIRNSFGEFFRVSREISNMSSALNVSREAYQVLGDLVEDTGGQVSDLVQALNQEKQALAGARDERSAAAASYRMLGLSIAEMERMPEEQRLEAIGRAMNNAKDRTAAYEAASNILGSRTLPRLTNALRALATDGYQKVAQEAKDAGKVLDDYAINRATEAEKYLRDVKQTFMTGAGETVAGWSLILKAFRDDFAGTMDAIVNGQFIERLSKFYNSPSPTPANSDDEGDFAARLAQQRNAITLAEHLIEQKQRDQQLTENDPTLLESTRREKLVSLIRDEISARAALAALIKSGPVDPKQDDATKDATIAKLEDEIRALQNRIIALTGVGLKGAPKPGGVIAGLGIGLAPSEYAKTEDSYAAMFGLGNKKATRAGDPNFMTAGEGMMAGFMKWSMSIGSIGGQISNTLQGTIGGAISSVSDGIVGLITKTKTWGDVGRSVGMLFLQSLVQIGVQMAAQKAITAAITAFHVSSEDIKTSSTEEGAAARAAAVAGEAAAEAPATGLGAVLHSIMALGPIAGPLVMMTAIAGMMALVSSLTGRETGGPVRAGTPYIVGEKRAEIFVPNQDGTILPSTDRYRVAAGGSSAAYVAASGKTQASAMQGKPERVVLFASERAFVEMLKRSTDFETTIVDITQRNMGTFAAHA